MSPWIRWDLKNWKIRSRSPSNRATCPAAVYVDLSSLRLCLKMCQGCEVWRYAMISLWLHNDFRWFKWVGIATRDTFGYKAGLFSFWSHRFGFLCLAVKTLQCLDSAGSTTAAINELLWPCMADLANHSEWVSLPHAFMRSSIPIARHMEATWTNR